MAKPGKAEKWATRSRRLSSALRENLKRRKAQARGRAAGEKAEREATEAQGEPGTETPDFRRIRGNE